MGKCAKDKLFVTIALSKEVVDILNNVVERISEKNNIKMTKSILIEHMVKTYIVESVEQNKEENENA